MPDVGDISETERSLFELRRALDAAKQSVRGDVPLNTGPVTIPGGIQEWSGIPRLDPTEFGRLASRDRELYMTGIRRLPEPYLNQFFETPKDTKWTKEMIDQYLSPWMDVHRTGTPYRGI